MFRSARLKLTGWYLLIIMIISITFSVVIYQVMTLEFTRLERMQRLRREIQLPFQLRRPTIDMEILRESENRLRATLIFINLAILFSAGIAGYFLAGRTLRPIKKMVDEQNRFITDASHELRTPLTSLKTEIEVNLRDKDLNLKEAKDLLKSNLEEVNNLQYLSDNLIKLTQYQTSNKNTFEETSLEEILNEAIKKIASLAKHKNIKIENKTKFFSLFADKQGLTEVFVILLDNAIKYSSKGKKVSITAKNIDNFLEINVSDQGIGINEEGLPYLFNRFYRADKSRTKENVVGYGLGLSIAKQIIKNHKGSVKVTSKINEGTTFSIKLPV